MSNRNCVLFEKNLLASSEIETHASLGLSQAKHVSQKDRNGNHQDLFRNRCDNGASIAHLAGHEKIYGG